MVFEELPAEISEAKGSPGERESQSGEDEKSNLPDSTWELILPQYARDRLFW